MKNKKLKAWALNGLFICATLLSSQDLFAQKTGSDRALPEFEAQYAIELFGLKAAEAHYNLSYTDTGYKFTQSTRLYGIASVFRNDTVDAVSYIDRIGDQLLLQKHQYIQTGEEKNKNREFSIEWDRSVKPVKGTISGIVRGEQIDLQSEGPVWEALSFQIPLMIEVNENVKDYPYHAILKGEINTYHFVLTSSREIAFATKKYQALQMVRKDPNRNRQLHIWLLPELHNIPVIIENYRDGKIHSRMQLETVKLNNEKTLIQDIDTDDY